MTNPNPNPNPRVRRKPNKVDFRPANPNGKLDLLDGQPITPAEGGWVYTVRYFQNGQKFALVWQFPNGPEWEQPDMVSLANEVGTIIQWRRNPATNASEVANNWQFAVPTNVTTGEISEDQDEPTKPAPVDTTPQPIPTSPTTKNEK